MAKIFVSYARSDQEFVSRLKAALAPAGHEAWIDTEGLRPSEQWRVRLQSAIDESAAVLVVLSPEWIKSPECRHELEHALSGHKKLVPILFKDVDPAKVPDTVRDLHWIHWRDQDDAADAARRTALAIETDLEWVDRHTALLAKARAWEQDSRRGDLLLRGQALKEGEDWISQAASHPKNPPSTLHAEYLLAGRRAATRRSRIIGGVSALAFAVTGAAGTWGWQQQKLRDEEARTALATQKADEEEKKRLAAESAAATASASEATARRKLAEAEAEKAREAEHQQLLLKQEQASLREVAEGYRLIYRDPAQTAVHALRASQARASGDSKRAMEDAWRVAIERRGNRLSMANLRDIDGLSFARRERLGDVHSVIGRSGRHVLLTTPRAGDPYTPRIPGEVYLLDSQTLRTTALEVCGQGVGRPRLEYAGFSSTGDQVFVTRSFYVDVYDIDGRCAFGRRTLQFESTKQPVHLVAGLLSARFLIGADSEGRVWLLDTRRQLPPKPVETLGRSTYDLRSSGDTLIDVPISPDGRHAIALFESGRAVMLRTSDDGLAASTPLAQSEVLAVAFDPSAKGVPRWAMAHLNGTVELWRYMGERAHAQRQLLDKGQPTDVLTYAEDGTVLVTIDSRCALRLWDTERGRLLHTQAAPTGADCAASPRPRQLAARPSAAPVPDGPVPYAALPRNSRIEAKFADAHSEILALAISRDGHWVASGGEDGSVHLWDLRTRRLGRQWSLGSFDRIRALAFSPDGGRLAAASQSGKLGYWDTVTGKVASGQPPDDHGLIRAMVFTGPQSLAVATDKDRLLTWDLPRGVPLAKAVGSVARTRTLLLDPNGSLVVGRESGPPVVLNADDLRVLDEPSSGDATPILAMDERGHTLAGSDGRTVRLWLIGPLRTVTREFRLPGARVSSLALSPDGRVVAAGLGSGMVRLWATETGQILADLKGGHGATPIDSLRFLPGGQQLLSGGGDHKVVLWDLLP